MSPLPPAGPAGAGPAPPAPAPAGSAAERPALQQAAEHLAAGRPAHAADALGRIAAETPTYAAAHVLHAVALEAAGRPADALAAWHRAAFLVPRSPLVLRERQRLVALSPAETPADPPAPAVWTETPAPEPTETAAPETAASETAASETAASPDGAAPDEPAGDVDAVPETIPLDDLAPSFTLDPDDDGDFDPDGFDLSAFDLGDEALGDDDDWLGLATPGAPPPGDSPSGESPPEESLFGGSSSGGSSAGRPAFGEEPAASAWLDDDPAPPLTDWADRLGDDALRLMPPEPAAAPEPAAPRADAPSAWAVFEDEPATTPAPPPAAETLPTPDAAPPDAAPAGAAAAPPPSVGDELDSLIASLEHVPRIRPDPAFRGPAVGTAGTEADVAEMASETLARIYAAQHQYVRAALVYETLAAREPGRADALLEQAAAMRQRRAG